LRRVLNAAGSLAADFAECLPHREQISRSAPIEHGRLGAVPRRELGRITIRLTPA